MKLNIISCPNKEDIVRVAAIAKTAYHSENYEVLVKNLSYDEAKKFLATLIKWGHESTIEPLILMFNLTGVSRVLTHQLVRHRIASYLQKSARRKRKYDEADFVYPTESKYIGVYKKIWTFLAKSYESLIEAGEDPDFARRILPQGLSTEITVTINMRSLRNLLRLRLSTTADYEIRELSNRLVSELKRHDLTFLIRDIIEEYDIITE